MHYHHSLLRQDYHIGTARKMSVDRRHSRPVVAYSAEVAHRAVLIRYSFLIRLEGTCNCI